MNLEQISRDLGRAMTELSFGPPAAFVYNPLEYAWEAHRAYLRFARKRPQALLIGMNPGPWGMAQTGVPFGAVGMVRDWLGIDAEIGRPEREHPKRPVEGLACSREEVSGKRLWGWARDTFETPERFFERFFVTNYCPLLFLEEGARNLIPEKIRGEERKPMLEICDAALRRTVEEIRPEHVLGVGAFAEKRAKVSLEGLDVKIGRVLHPSPASPAANRGWAEAATRQLRELGIEV